MEKDEVREIATADLARVRAIIDTVRQSAEQVDDEGFREITAG